MFYLISSCYVGPNNRDSNGDSTLIDREGECCISTVPGRTNMSNEERTEGWLGTHSDYSATALGEFETLAEAREAAREAGYTEIVDPVDDIFGRDETTVEVYTTKIGVSTVWFVDDYLYEVRHQVDGADTSDSVLSEWIEEMEADAESENITIDGDIEGFVNETRYANRREALEEYIEEEIEDVDKYYLNTEEYENPVFEVVRGNDIHQVYFNPDGEIMDRVNIRLSEFRHAYPNADRKFIGIYGQLRNNIVEFTGNPRLKSQNPKYNPEGKKIILWGRRAGFFPLEMEESEELFDACMSAGIKYPFSWERSQRMEKKGDHND